MHDIRALRADPAAFDAAMARRALPPQSAAILALDTDRRAALTALQEKQARRNAVSKEIGQAKRTGADTQALEAEGTALRTAMEALESRAAGLEAKSTKLLGSLPNILDDDVPDGADETGNVELKRWGVPPEFGFAPKQHFELGEALGLMDFAGAAKIAGGAIHHPARRAGAAGNARWGNSCSTCTRPSMAIPNAPCHSWSMTRRFTAPINYRNSPRIRSAPRMGAG